MSAHRHYRRQSERALWPNTTMASAYLIAITEWARTHHENLEARVTLPIGVVGAEEVLKVLRALEKARRRAAMIIKIFEDRIAEIVLEESEYAPTPWTSHASYFAAASSQRR